MRKIIALILLVFCTSNAVGQSVWTTVDSEDKLVDGGVYFLTGVYNNTKYAKIPSPNSDNPFQYSALKNSYTSITTSINDILRVSHLFKIEKIDGIWYIKDINLNKYIGKNTIIAGTNTAAHILLRTVPDDYCKASFTFSDKTNTPQWTIKVHERYLCAAPYIEMMSLRQEATTKENQLFIYRLNYTVLDAGDNLKEINLSNKTIMYRSFLTGIYNTLILPCDVTDYKTVFGSEVTAYEVTGMTEDNIYIDEVRGNSLTAGKPYLLKGNSFNKSPYQFGTQTVEYDGSTEPVTHYGGGTVHGVYATRPVPENAFFMFNDQFIPYQKDKIVDQAMTISPYKWYVETNGSHTAKRITLQTASTTAIKTPRKVDNNHQTTIYTLSGQRIEKDAPLRKGIYIVDKKKVMMK